MKKFSETVAKTMFSSSITAEICDSQNLADDVTYKEELRALQTEIARLSETRRKIVIAYYYENKSVKQIANQFDITVATVKWHLFESRKNLKDGLEKMRTNELNFNPVKFELAGYSGSAGKMGGTASFFHSALSQNIAFCVYRKSKTVNQIADELGVSPVYVASEAEFLEKYGYLIKKGNTYIANILIEGGDGAEETVKLQDKMYKDAAKIFAVELYESLVKSGLLDDNDIESCYKTDKNFLLWALVPYIVANSGNVDEQITFEECATRRLDGSFDIAYAVLQSDVKMQYDYSMKKWYGPAWTNQSGTILWGCRSEWSSEKDMKKYISNDNLSLLLHILNNAELLPEQYASLTEQGFIRMVNGKAELSAVRLNSREINDKLLLLGQAVHEKYKTQLARSKKLYEKAVLDLTPPHLKRAAQYGMQYVFHADGWFIIYVLNELLLQGKLKLPTAEQKLALMTVIAPAS